MAVAPLTLGQIHGHTTPNGFVKDGSGNQVMGCFVSIYGYTVTYDTSAHANMAAVGAGILASRRDGRTVTLMQACMASPGKKSDGTIIGASGCAISTDAITCNLTQADLSTELGNGTVADTFLEPIVLFVLFKF